VQTPVNSDVVQLPLVISLVIDVTPNPVPIPSVSQTASPSVLQNSYNIPDGVAVVSD